MADLILTGALTTRQLGDVVFTPLTDEHNPGTIDTIAVTVLNGPGTATPDPSNPLVYTVDAVNAEDSLFLFDIDMQPGAEVRNFQVELHLTGTEPGVTTVEAVFTNVRPKS